MALLRGLRLERARASPQYRDGAFHNRARVRAPMQDTSRWGIARDFMFGGHKRLPPGPIPVERPHEAWARAPGHGLRLTWLGHSTVLIESDGLRILTDPVFGRRASPVGFAGPARFHPVPATIAELPPLDAVLISHDHYDHLCAPSVRALAARRVPMVTSLGVGARLEALGADPALVHELDWWDELTLPGADVGFAAVPAQHFSGRGVGDRNHTLWSSWIISTGRHKVFFSGDTGLHDDLAAIRARHGRFDVTMLEVGAWNQAWGDVHLGPHGAVRAFAQLGGDALLPIHWGTFDLGLHPWAEPAEQLLALTEAAATPIHLLTPILGRPFVPALHEPPTPWWRQVGARRVSDEPVPAPAAAVGPGAD
jgi:L-ascorbate metabolism protein UlaG (beta-lactamase superfamily)